jgi:hypothetical protein|tara:strand:+ start:349 stop:507 length:159 start_codon:yes stop_codon:yes gene_type:complete
MSTVPGACKVFTVAINSGIGVVGSTTKNPPSPLEYGRQILSGDLSNKGLTNC